MLDKLDTLLLLLPQLEMPVHARRDDKVGSDMSSEEFLGARHSLGDGDKVDGIPVHETLVVPVRVRQMLEVRLLVRQHWHQLRPLTAGCGTHPLASSSFSHP